MKSLERLLKEGECDAVADAFAAACNDDDFTFLCWDVTFNVELVLRSGKRVGSVAHVFCDGILDCVHCEQLKFDMDGLNGTGSLGELDVWT